MFAENHPTETVPYACAGWDDGISRIQVDVDVLVNELMSFSMQDIIELSDVVKDTVSFE